MAIPLEVFCCYAREDQEMLEQLQKHLTPLQRQNQITIWSDINLNAGARWEDEIHQHLEKADIFLLLISPSFMASDYCYGIEMKRAIERHNEGSALVIPVLLRFVHWQNAPFADLQVLPKNALPVANWSDRDEAFHHITEQIRQTMIELQTRRMSNKARSSPSQEHPAPGMDDQKKVFPFIEIPDAIEVLHTLTEHRSIIRGVALSGNGLVLATGSYDKTIKLWNTYNGLVLYTFTNRQGTITSVALSANGLMLASGGDDQTIKLWNARLGRPIRTLTGHKETVTSVALSTDGLILASGSDDRTVKLWETLTGKCLRTMAEHSGAVKSVALSADGLTLASGSDDQTIRLWDAQTGKCLHELTGHMDTIKSVALSADGLVLATTGSWDRMIKVWNVRTGQCLLTLTDAVSSIALSADGLVLASNNADTITLWNVEHGQPVRVLTNHTGAISSLAFSMNGQMLASGTATGVITIWGVKD